MLACVTNTCIACLSTKPKMTPSSLSKTHSEHSHHTPTTTFPRSRRNTSSIKKRQEGCMYWHHKAIFILRYNKPTWVTLQGSPTSNAKTHTHTHIRFHSYYCIHALHYIDTTDFQSKFDTYLKGDEIFMLFGIDTTLTHSTQTQSITHSLTHSPSSPPHTSTKQAFFFTQSLHPYHIATESKETKMISDSKKAVSPLFPLWRRRRGGNDDRHQMPPSRVILFRIRFFSIENTFL